MPNYRVYPGDDDAGLSIREYFALELLKVAGASPAPLDRRLPTREEMVRAAIQWADALIVALNETPPPQI